MESGVIVDRSPLEELQLKQKNVKFAMGYAVLVLIGYSIYYLYSGVFPIYWALIIGVLPMAAGTIYLRIYRRRFQDYITRQYMELSSAMSEPVTIEDLAHKSGIDERDVRIILEHFQEKGMVQANHTGDRILYRIA